MNRLAPVAALALFAAGPLAAEGIAIEDAYARASGPTAVTGAVFLEIANLSAEDDRLVAASTEVAQRTELHTHLQSADGVMRMVEVEDGFAVAPGETRALARGGDHIMLLGLTRPLGDGDSFPLTLVFERAGEVTIEVPVDLGRMPAAGHGAHGSGG